MRFKRSGRKVGLKNYKDGEIYWKMPRHLKYPWFEPVVESEMPIVKEATAGESVFVPIDSTESFERIISEELSGPATISESGYTLSSSGIIDGKFQEPEGSKEEVAEVVMPKPAVPKLEVKEEELGFPVGAYPSLEWRKAELLAFIRHRGGVAKSGMKKDTLLGIALNLV